MKKSRPIRLPLFRDTNSSEVAKIALKVFEAAKAADDDWIFEVVCEQDEDNYRQWLDQIRKTERVWRRS